MEFKKVISGTPPYLSELLRALQDKYNNLLLFTNITNACYHNRAIIKDGSVYFEGLDYTKNFSVPNVRVNEVAFGKNVFYFSFNSGEIEYRFTVEARIIPSLD